MRAGRIFLALLAMGTSAGWLEWHTRPPEWPVITDPELLRQEATVLCYGEGGWRELPPVKYPSAMLKLRPTSISVCGERVYIALVPAEGGHTRYHGYYIWPKTDHQHGNGIEREENDGVPTPQ